MKTVYTYHEHISGMYGIPLLIEWKKSWEANGWRLKILGRTDAMRHPRFHQFLKRVQRHPTVNGRPYEDACYLRHLAMAAIVPCGPMLMTDYDVLNVRFKPDDLAGDTPYVLDSDGVPCALCGTASDWEQIVRFIERYPLDKPVTVGNRPHMSDMYMIQSIGLRRTNQCILKDKTGWDSAPLVHFGHVSTPGDRAEAMRNWFKRTRLPH